MAVDFGIRFNYLTGIFVASAVSAGDEKSKTPEPNGTLGYRCLACYFILARLEVF